MIMVEDKLKLFSDIIYEKIENEKQKDFDLFEKEREEILKNQQDKLDLYEKKILKDIYKRANSRANEIVAKAKVESQHNMLKMKEEYINKMYSELRERLIKFTISDEYKDFLFNVINSTILNIKYGSYILYLSKEDILNYDYEIKKIIDSFQGKDFEVRESNKNIIGGIIIESSTTKFRIDNSLITKLEDCKGNIGLKIMGIL